VEWNKNINAGPDPMMRMGNPGQDGSFGSEKVSFLLNYPSGAELKTK
jgi:hypothetical protein